MKLHAAASFLSVGLLDSHLADLRYRQHDDEDGAKQRPLILMADAARFNRPLRRNNKKQRMLDMLRNKHGIKQNIKQGIKWTVGKNPVGDVEPESPIDTGVFHSKIPATRGSPPLPPCNPDIGNTLPSSTDASSTDLSCPDGSRCIPTPMSDAGGFCVGSGRTSAPMPSKDDSDTAAKNAKPSFVGVDVGARNDVDVDSNPVQTEGHHRSLQTFPDDDRNATELFNSLCSPDGENFGQCYNCPQDPNFDITQDAIFLTCKGDGDCVQYSTYFFYSVVTADPITYETFVYNDVAGPFPTYNCTVADFIYDEYCGNAPTEERNCTCPGGGFDPNTDSALVTCERDGNPCVELIVKFTSGAYPDLILNYDYACTYINNFCSYEGCNCDIDLSKGYSLANGTISCVAYGGCVTFDATINNGDFLNRAYYLDSSETCTPPLGDTCYGDPDCSCTLTDPSTSSYTGNCSVDCGTYTFSAEDGVFTERLSGGCYYTEFGEFCMSYSLDGYECPTLNGQACQCNPVECGPLDRFPAFLQSFDFDCGNGLSGNTCTDSFFNQFTLCALESVDEYCSAPYGYSQCDCSELARDDGPYASFAYPLTGRIYCQRDCGETMSLTFSGDSTFQQVTCTPNNNNDDYSQVCVVYPFPSSGDCGMFTDGSACTGCESVECSIFNDEEYGIAGICPSGDSQSVYVSTCYVDSCIGYGPADATEMPSYAPYMIQTSSPTLLPTGTPPAGDVPSTSPIESEVSSTSAPSATADTGTGSETSMPIVGPTQGPTVGLTKVPTAVPSEAAMDRGLTASPTSAEVTASPTSAGVMASSWTPTCRAIVVGVAAMGFSGLLMS